jgi:hypothetical protein
VLTDLRSALRALAQVRGARNALEVPNHVIRVVEAPKSFPR